MEGTGCVCSLPDPLREKLSHVPHQGAAPVVAHQVDPRDGLEDTKIAFKGAVGLKHANTPASTSLDII